jgi:hypothetical protein
MAGYGTTTWKGLVPAESKKNLAMSMSTPIDASEGGVAWGLFAGYEFMPYFALETRFMHYPNAKINFSPESLYAFENHGMLYLNTHTVAGSLLGKFMVVIPSTSMRAYSSVGFAVVHRRDALCDRYRGAPAFGVGLNSNVTEHVMIELGTIFTTGYAESDLRPVNNYVPFLYAGFLQLAYRF